MTPTARSLRHLREAGWYAEIVERRIPRCFITRDLAGWIDVCAWRADGKGVLGIQVTSGSNVSARLAKASGNGALVAWISAGNQLVLHGWRKLKGRWALRQIPLTIRDIVKRSP